MYNYKRNIQAEEDLKRIFEYGMNQFGLNEAYKYFDMFFECFSKISSNPFLFPSADHYKKVIATVFLVLPLFFINLMATKLKSWQ